MHWSRPMRSCWLRQKLPSNLITYAAWLQDPFEERGKLTPAKKSKRSDTLDEKATGMLMLVLFISDPLTARWSCAICRAESEES